MNKKRRAKSPPSNHPPTTRNKDKQKNHRLTEDNGLDKTDSNHGDIEPVTVFLHSRLYRAIHKKHQYITLWDEYSLLSSGKRRRPHHKQNQNQNQNQNSNNHSHH